MFLALNAFGCVQKQRQIVSEKFEPNKSAININTASAEELEKLPGIGADSARRIVEHREKHGRFQSPEELLLLRGISEKKFRELRAFIKTE